ncbi:Mannosyltransferase related to Gpi18 [Butyrivibrio proteoclasticus]|uniref:Mannosyltransferase related to Gpi18 n=1 Tax=Butyrivibrio proteoclasticus TaxID=43305 RepID=A0A1I5PQ30_9FIRM|nr:hypothetical protein [Butyrivibrio proteoclasticus]SFP36104.1 Mannosyltransferase related to Gpi18 [Butyrivibrio proteoclasticus]
MTIDGNNIFDKIIRHFVKKKLDWIAFAFFAVLSIWIRLSYAPVTDIEGGLSDYNTSLLPWVREYSQLGIVGGLAKGIGNYYIPYNLFLAIIPLTGRNPAMLIAAVSALFDYLTVFAIYKIVKLLMTRGIVSIRPQYVKVASILFSIMPVMVLNSSLWKQCDSIYTSFVLFSLYYFFRNKTNISFIFLGIAFCFKLQSIFIIPFFLIAYLLTDKISIVHFLYIPLCYFIAGIPAIVCGRNALSVYGIYFGQVSDNQSTKLISESFPGIYNIGLSSSLFNNLAILIAISVMAIVLLVVSKYYILKEFSEFEWLYLAGFSALTCVEFLPNMHDRYDYLPIMIMTIIAVFFRKEVIIPTLGLHLVSACVYGRFLFGYDIDMRVLSVAYLVFYIWISFDFIEKVLIGSRKEVLVNEKK